MLQIVLSSILKNPLPARILDDDKNIVVVVAG
jgi:hypothetical protein